MSLHTFWESPIQDANAFIAEIIRAAGGMLLFNKNYRLLFCGTDESKPMDTWPLTDLSDLGDMSEKPFYLKRGTRVIVVDAPQVHALAWEQSQMVAFHTYETLALQADSVLAFLDGSTDELEAAEYATEPVADGETPHRAA